MSRALLNNNDVIYDKMNLSALLRHTVILGRFAKILQGNKLNVTDTYTTFVRTVLSLINS